MLGRRLGEDPVLFPITDSKHGVVGMIEGPVDLGKHELQFFAKRPWLLVHETWRHALINFQATALMIPYDPISVSDSIVSPTFHRWGRR
jgi:hypothetical protein